MWYFWSHTDDLDYYSDYGYTLYCYYGELYLYDPAFWFYIADWNWVWVGSCLDYISEYADYWFYDSWYYWAAAPFDYYYSDDGQPLYCNNGLLYAWDPFFWGVDGWTWYV
jgi:hypothetical protein